jgi:hypothetical protein
MERKEFIRTSGRWLIFGFLAFATGSLALKKKISVKEDACSILKGPCNDCAVLATCTLPGAVKIKNHEKNKRL